MLVKIQLTQFYQSVFIGTYVCPHDAWWISRICIDFSIFFLRTSSSVYHLERVCGLKIFLNIELRSRVGARLFIKRWQFIEETDWRQLVGDASVGFPNDLFTHVKVVDWGIWHRFYLAFIQRNNFSGTIGFNSVFWGGSICVFFLNS